MIVEVAAAIQAGAQVVIDNILTDNEDIREFQERLSHNHNNKEGLNDTKVNPGLSIAHQMPGQTNEESKTSFIFKNAKMWAVEGKSFFACEKSVDTLPRGIYTIQKDEFRGIFFNQKNNACDDLLPFPDSSSDKIIENIMQFWGLEDHFKSYGFLWKRGFLIWGPPGSGKTSTINLVSKSIINQNGIVIFSNYPPHDTLGLHILRSIEPDRPIVFIFEDIDAIINCYGESSLLPLLDGDKQINKVVYIATTNYPERLDKRFINRPSRFDVVQKIGMPNEECRKIFIEAKSRKIKNNIRRAVKDTEGFSFAHIKELIISVEVFQHDYDSSLQRLKIMIECNSSSEDDYKVHMGFNKTK